MKSAIAVTFSRGIKNIPFLNRALGMGGIIRRPPFSTRLQSRRQLPEVKLVIGWGRKANTAPAHRFATARNLPYLSIEDGFLRSVGLGVNGAPPLSVVVDDLGIYYDGSQPSRLESILKGEYGDLPDLPPFKELRKQLKRSPDPLNDEALLERAGRCIRTIVENGLSKYNESPEFNLGDKEQQRILVVDQTAGDLSIEYGLAKPESFHHMLQTALDEHPEAEILVKIHPDVVAGKKQGHLLDVSARPRVRLIGEEANPIHLLQQVDKVYVVSSQIGFEALMAGVPVTCFGAPFYAGWGLTDDRLSLPRREGHRRSLEQLFAAAYLLYARYIDPENGEPCEIERVIEHLALQRRFFRENAGDLVCLGFGPWKRGYVRAYLHSPWNRIRYVGSAEKALQKSASDESRIVVWGDRDSAETRAFAAKRDIPVWRMEDGFLRSVGLGSDLTAPASLVLDKKGIYFDPTRPSDLEQILQEARFSDTELGRATALRQLITSTGLSKYNVGDKTPLTLHAQPGQRVILVPGQVEHDASIRLGCRDIRTNAQLLRAVRESHPDAYIVYKPHPDVLSGNKGVPLKAGENPGYDQLVTDVALSLCLEQVDEIHSMTSLVGFEGLLRDKTVATYGLPFYAGWGLTRDRHPLPRRSRTLTLDELVAGCLIRYPRYLNWKNGEFISPESAVRHLRQAVANSAEVPIRRTWGLKQGMKFMQFIRGLLYAWQRQ